MQRTLQEKRNYATPIAEQINLTKGKGLLTSFSGDIEAWEDDEELMIEP